MVALTNYSQAFSYNHSWEYVYLNEDYSNPQISTVVADEIIKFTFACWIIQSEFVQVLVKASSPQQNLI